MRDFELNLRPDLVAAARGSGGCSTTCRFARARGPAVRARESAYDYITRERRVRGSRSRSGHLHRVRQHAVVG